MTTLMTLRDLYQKKIASATSLLQMASEEEDAGIRRALRSQALGFQTQAGHLAHCLAHFGDSLLADMPLAEFRIRASELLCVNENPWARGLAVIQEELAS